MDFDQALKSFYQLHTQYGGALDNGLLLFARCMAFIFFALALSVIAKSPVAIATVRSLCSPWYLVNQFSIRLSKLLELKLGG